MKITVKTLQNKKYELDIGGATHIKDVKQRIHESLDLAEPALQKIIHHGKILKDDQAVADVGIKEKDFLVVMVTKPKKKKAEPKPAEVAPAQQAASSSAPPSSAAAASSSAVNTPAPNRRLEFDNSSSPAADDSSSAAPSAAAASNDAADASSAFASGSEYETIVTNLMSLTGAPRANVATAMRAAFNNPDRAAEYLFNGIPDHARQAPPQPAAAPAAGASSEQAPAVDQVAPAPQGQGQGAPDPAQLAGLMQMLQSNPQALAPILQQIVQSNPQLAQAVGNNPQALQQMLQNPQMMQMLLGMMMQGGAGGQGGAPGQQQGPPPGAHVIQLTEAEAAAVQRLQGLGFTRNRALEAYLLCDKNEELAANFLFDHMGDDDQEMAPAAQDQQPPQEQQ